MSKRRKRDTPEGVGDILKALAADTALGKQLEQARIWERWPELAGQHLAPHGQPRGVRDRLLIVEVESSVWMHKFAYRKWDLIGRINRMAGEELVSDVYFVLANEPSADGSQDGA